MRQRSRARRILKWVGLATAVLVVLAVYLGWFHRWRTTAQRDGWLVQYTFIMCKCRCCFGQIERLECNGIPLPTPQLEENNRIYMTSPVGVFELRSYGDGWWIHHHFDERAGFISEPITPEELRQGWYPSGHERLEGQRTPPRKKGTPPRWCWAWSLRERCCWLDPAMLDRLDWGVDVSTNGTAD